MSLLNEVLQDIDQRRRESTEQSIATSVLASPKSEGFDWSYPIMMLTVVFIFGSLTYWLVNREMSQSTLQSTFELPIASTPLPQSRFNSAIPAVVALQVPASTAPLDIDMELAGSSSVNFEVVDQNPAQTRSVIVDNSVSPTDDLSAKNFVQFVELAVLGNIDMDTFRTEFNQHLAGATLAEIQAAMDRFDYSARSVDDLLSLLSVNKRLVAVMGMDRSPILHNIFSQLRLKSQDPGYWAFQQAVLYDKANNARQAYYYYRQALRTDDISVKQRRLSQLRIEQLQGRQR